MKIKYIGMALMLGLVAGCASTPKIGNVEFRKPVKIQSFPDSKPNWAEKSDVQFERDDYKYFVGYRKGRGITNESVAETLATNNATENILLTLAHDAGYVIETGLSGKHDETTGEAAKKAVVQGATLVKIWGLHKMEAYNEEMGQVDEFNQKLTYWNSWVLFRVKKTDYDKMLAKALDNGISVAQKASNQEAVDVIKEVKVKMDKAQEAK